MASKADNGAGGQKTALITGATGITGRHLLDALLRRNKQQKGPAGKEGGGQAEWRVVTLARRDLQGLSSEEEQAVQPADLLDNTSVEWALKEAGVGAAVTHIFHCAYLMKDEPPEECEVNARMLRSVVEAVEGAGATLQHVYCMEGGKWYGQQLHVPLKTPHREDDPPIMPPMFYFELQNYLEGRVKEGAGWTWSALRPNPVWGSNADPAVGHLRWSTARLSPNRSPLRPPRSTGSFMNLSTSIAVYAAVCKELGLLLRFPGSETTYNAVNDACDAELLAEAMVHLATNPACANRAFNISNGDVFCRKDLWPKVAAFFGMQVAPPLAVPLSKVMADKGPVWDSLVKKHGLQATPLDKLATWKFADFIFTVPGDVFSTTTALARTGFGGQCVDTDEMFERIFRAMRQQKVIP